MSFMQLQNHLESATGNLKPIVEASDESLLHHVFAGLRHLSENLHEFDKAVVVSKSFLNSFRNNLKFLSSLHSPENIGFIEPEVKLSMTKEVAFSLFEELAVFFREKVLHPDHSATPVESSLLKKFESSSFWEPDDNALVCKFYYCYLPGFFSGDFGLEKIKQLSQDLEQG